MTISDELFSELLTDCVNEIPDRYAANLQNVVITYADDPSPEQLSKLRPNETLFGLYEGIPLTQRGAGYNLVLPDKITIFKNPIIRSVGSLSQLRQELKHTLWHEVGHYFGLDHERIHELEQKNQLPS